MMCQAEISNNNAPIILTTNAQHLGLRTHPSKRVFHEHCGRWIRTTGLGMRAIPKPWKPSLSRSSLTRSYVFWIVAYKVSGAGVRAPACYPGLVKKKAQPLNFPQHLATLREGRVLTQHVRAEMVHMHISQIRRYEGGQALPTMALHPKQVVRSVIQSIILRNTMKEAERRFHTPDSGEISARVKA